MTLPSSKWYRYNQRSTDWSVLLQVFALNNILPCNLRNPKRDKKSHSKSIMLQHIMKIKIHHPGLFDLSPVYYILILLLNQTNLINRKLLAWELRQYFLVVYAEVQQNRQRKKNLTKFHDNNAVVYCNSFVVPLYMTVEISL